MSLRRKFAPRRKYCRFCENSEIPLNYKHPEVLNDFVTDRGKIIASRITGTCAKHQRALTREIKRARQMALIFYTATHSTDVLKKSRV
ncbi:MAG: 30S ribosomal protein S18 [Desulfomicrobium sp.]|jgi:small subunit ribosomal protein S18|nr:30S ribosomal protein S18 [Desulfomicrobium sp.]NLV96932.1 30S ribosomal protein S18 [Desulfovibrionales bacterium]